MRPRGLRRRVTLLVAVAAAFTLAVLTIGFNLALRAVLEADGDRVLRSRADAALEAVAVSDRGLRPIEPRHEAGPDSAVWIYEGLQSLERGQGPASLQQLADELAGRPGEFADDPSTQTRLYSRPVPTPSGTDGAIVSALSVEPYEQIESRSLLLSLAFDVVVFVLIVVGSRLVVGRALRPVAEMTEEAAKWSESDLDQRFDVGEPADELTELAATFDRLLDRIAASLRHERRLTAEISHELRTPLASIAAETELALRRSREPKAYRATLERVASKAVELERILDALLAAARAETSPERGASELGAATTRVAKALREASQGQGVSVEERPAEEAIIVEGDEDLVARIISPVLENACRHARSRVVVSSRRASGLAELRIEDDGPGVPPDDLEAIFEPGVWGRTGAGNSERGGAGLGLALSRRLARALGGEVVAERRGAEAGGCFLITLPARERSPG